MPKTAVGLFKNPEVVDDVVRELMARGFPRNEVRALEEPASSGATGVMSFPRLDFEVDMLRELTRIGATKAQSEAYVNGLRRGGALVFATGVGERVDTAAAIMDRHGAIEVEETTGPKPDLPHVVHEEVAPADDNSSHTAMFAW